MTALQARLLAGRAVRAAQAQEEFARRLRPPTSALPVQPTAQDADRRLAVVRPTG